LNEFDRPIIDRQGRRRLERRVLGRVHRSSLSPKDRSFSASSYVLNEIEATLAFEEHHVTQSKVAPAFWLHVAYNGETRTGFGDDGVLSDAADNLIEKLECEIAMAQTMLKAARLLRRRIAKLSPGGRG